MVGGGSKSMQVGECEKCLGNNKQLSVDRVQGVGKRVVREKLEREIGFSVFKY